MLAVPFSSLAREALKYPALIPSRVQFLSQTLEVNVHLPWTEEMEIDALTPHTCKPLWGDTQGHSKGIRCLRPCIMHLHTPRGPVGWGQFRGGTGISPHTFCEERNLRLCWPPSWHSWKRFFLSCGDYDSNPDLGEVSRAILSLSLLSYKMGIIPFQWHNVKHFYYLVGTE